MKRFLCILFALLFGVTLFGCSKEKKTPDGYPVAVGDVIINQKPQKIAVTSAALRTVMEQLGFGSITVDASTVFSSGVGDLTGGNDEIDVVLTNEELYPAQKKILQGVNVPFVQLELPTTLSELKLYWETLGRIADGDNGAVMAMEKFQKLSSGLDGIKLSDDVTAVILYDMEHCAAEGLAAESLKAAGFINAAGEVLQSDITYDALKTVDPDYIFVAKGLKKPIQDDRTWSDLTAVKNGNVFEIDVMSINFGLDKLFSEIKYMNSVVPVKKPIDSDVSGSDDSGDLNSTDIKDPNSVESDE